MGLVRSDSHVNGEGWRLRATNETAGYRRNGFRMARHGHGNVAAGGKLPKGGVKTLPPGSWQVHLSPGVGRGLAGLGARGMQVAADKAASESQLSTRLDEQRCDVAARATGACKRLARALDARFLAHCVAEVYSDCLGQGVQQLKGRRYLRSLRTYLRPLFPERSI